MRTGFHNRRPSHPSTGPGRSTGPPVDDSSTGPGWTPRDPCGRDYSVWDYLRNGTRPLHPDADPRDKTFGHRCRHCGAGGPEPFDSEDGREDR